MREILSLNVNNFKRRCRDICDADQQRTKEESRNVNYSVNRSSQKRGKSNNVYNNYRRMGQNADDLVLVKMHFFSYVASLMQPFLTLYQSTQPIVAFMHEDIS